MTTRQRKESKQGDMKSASSTINDNSQSNKKQTDAQLKAKWQDMTDPKQLIITICMGIIFGFALNKGRVFEPDVIIDQFLFKRWIMMKMFLSAAASSTLCLSLMKIVTPKQYSIARAKCGVYNLNGCIIGGGILGMGMSIGGICPGMVLAQIGAGVENSILSLLSIMIGALIYGLIEPFIRFITDTKTLSYAFIDEIIPRRHLLSIMFATVMFGVVFILELLFPWKSELSTPLQPNCNIIECKAWPPYISGLLVGILQIPSVARLGIPIGSSTAYVCVMSQWLRVLPNSKQQFFKLFKSKLHSFWQVVFVCSAVFGSLLAVQLSGTMNALEIINKPYDGIKGNSSERAILGGLLLIFGARLARGCTSGHGISGMGMLSIASIITVASMFIGGAMIALIA